MSTANLVSVRNGAALIDAATSIDEADMNQESAAAHAAAAGWIALTLQQDRAACDEFLSQLNQHVSRPDVVTYLFCLLKDGARRLVVVEYCLGADLEAAVQAGEAESVPLRVLKRVVERMKSLRNPDDPAPDAAPVPSGPFVLDDFGLASAGVDEASASCGAAVVTPKHVQSFGPHGSDLHTFQTDLVHLDEVLSRQGVSRIVRAAAGDRPLKLWLGSSVPKQPAPPPAKKPLVTASVAPAIAPAPPPPAPVAAASIQSLAKAVSPVAPPVVPPAPAPAEAPPPRIIRVRLRDDAPPATPQVRLPDPPKPPKATPPPPAPPPAKEEKAAPVAPAPEPEPFTLGLPKEEKQRPRVVIWVGVGAAALIAVIVLLVFYLPKSAPPVAPQSVQAPVTSPAPAPKESAAQPQTTAPAPQPAAPAATAKDKPPETTAAVPAETAPVPAKKAEAAPAPPAPEKAAEDEAEARKKAAIKALTGQ